MSEQINFKDQMCKYTVSRNLFLPRKIWKQGIKVSTSVQLGGKLQSKGLEAAETLYANEAAFTY